MDNPKSLEKLLYYFLFLVFCFGLFFRTQGIFTHTYAFTYDVGRDFLVLRDMLLIHKIPLIGPTTGLHGLFYGPWWYYILFPSFLFSGGNPDSVLLFIALTGILTAGIGFWLGNRIGNNILGFLVCVAVLLSSELIGLSSQIWNPNLIPPIVFLVILLLDVFSVSGKKTAWSLYFLFGLLLTLIIDFEVIFGLLFFAAMVFSFILFFRKIITLKKIPFFLLGIFVIEFPKIFFELRHGFLMTKTLFSVSQNTEKNTVFSLNFDFLGRLKIFLTQFGNTIADNNMFLAFFIISFSTATLFLFWEKIPKREKLMVKIPLTMLIVFYFGFTFFSQAIWSHYLVGIPVCYILLITIAIFTFFTQVKNPVLTTSVLIAFFVIISFPMHIAMFFQQGAFAGDASVYKNQLRAIDYVYRQANGKSFKYILYTPPVNDYTYQYLFQWYGKKTYGYSPSQSSSLFFLIIEPDDAYPNRLKLWLRAREKDGIITSEKQVTGGIVVQERITH